MGNLLGKFDNLKFYELENHDEPDEKNFQKI